MTPHDLIAAFETLSEAPGGVKRLRELVLQLAVRGKLVAQDAQDEAASVLLKHIATEKARLVTNGLIRAQKPSPPVVVEEAPFELPATWRWTRTVELGVIGPRSGAGDDDMVGFVPMPVIPTDFRGRLAPEHRPWKEIKKSYTHLADGDVAVAKITPCFQNRKSCVVAGLAGGVGAGTTELHVVRPFAQYTVPEYLLAFFKTPDFIEGGVARFSGTAGQQRVPNEYFMYTPLPLPPFAEQLRIVARVDELMGLLDRLEAARNARHATRAALRDAALAALRNADRPDEVEVAWQRIAEGMDDLFTDPTDVHPLRQAVLQLAVRGKLVPQDSADEPASVLLERIATEKARLVKAGKIRRSEVLLPVSDDEVPFDAAPGWAWTRLDRLAASVTDGDHQSPPRAVEGVAFLTIGNVTTGRLDFSDTRFVPREYYDGLDELRRPAEGDILYTVVGATYGRPISVLGNTPFCVQRHIAIIRPIFVSRDYMCHFLKSPWAYRQATASKTGSAQPTVALGPLRRFSVPVPPIAEQHRIVAKVDELMSLLDRLEERLKAQRDLQDAFAAAAVHHLDA